MRENLATVLGLLLVTDDALLEGRDPVRACREAVDGGVTAVQLRLKHADDRRFLALARELVRTLAVPVFINDRMDLALASGAAGVHLGPDDLSPALARTIAPADFVIGASVGVAAEIDRGEPADYWGVGPFRATSSKRDAGEAIGVSGARAIRDAAGGRPCVLIGGVVPGDVAFARDAGFAGVAVISGILGAADVTNAARQYSRAAAGLS